MKRFLKGKGIGRLSVEGEALPSTCSISPDYIQRENGIYLEPGHELEGVPIKDKIIVCPSLKGSSVITHKLALCGKKESAPKGFIFTKLNTISVHSVLISKIPAVYGIDCDEIKKIMKGAFLKLNPLLGTVEVIPMD